VAQTLALGVLVLVIAAGAGLLGAMASADRTDPSAATLAPALDGIEEVDAVGRLEMRCIENGAGIEVPAVNAKADGVHVAITGTQGEDVFFQSSTGLLYQLQLRSDGGNFALPLPPGSWHGVCSPAEPGVPPRDAGAPFVVSDPNDHFVTSAPECPDDGCCVMVGELPDGFVQDQDTALREVFADDGIQDGDRIERAGYTESVSRVDPPTPLAFRVVRGSTVVAHIDAAEGADGWTYQLIGCPSAEV
jgi:hypothetical protein